ncbi:MAG: RNA polymerase sigma-70 factor (ECF subfamily) [Rhodothermales bacterium]|jgi:RNA polymerase sigma-70 factor (ECF subfamily)
MWKKLDQLDGPDGFLPWARIIVRFEAMRARRDFARDRLVLSEEIVDILAKEAVEVPDGQLERERCALRKCLQNLSDEHKRLVLAPYVQPGGVTTLAEQAGRSPNSLYKVLGRLRAKLRTCIRQRLLAEEPV